MGFMGELRDFGKFKKGERTYYENLKCPVCGWSIKKQKTKSKDMGGGE